MKLQTLVARVQILILLLGEWTVSIWPPSADDYNAKASILGRASPKGTTNRRGRMFHDESALDQNT